MKPQHENILVIGGQGKNGRRVVEKLRNMKYNVFFTSRSNQENNNNERYFDWNDQKTYSPALKEIQKVYIVHPDTSMPLAFGQLKELVGLMDELSVSKAVLLSGRGQKSVVECEEILINSSIKWTIIRSAWFNQNFSEGHFLGGIKSGEVVFMADSVKEPFVDLDDLSDVVVQCLLNEIHDGKLYEVTGGEALSFKEAVGIIGIHLNRKIDYKALDKDEYSNLLINLGLEASVAGHMTEAFSEILDGRNEHLGDGVLEVLKRHPRSFMEFVKSSQF